MINDNASASNCIKIIHWLSTEKWCFVEDVRISAGVYQEGFDGMLSGHFNQFSVSKTPRGCGLRRLFTVVMGKSY